MDIKKNDIYTMVIGDFGSEGEGIGKVDGFTLFVKDALIGDEIEVKVIKTKKNYGYGRLMKIIKPSPFRVEARCKNARACGGCQIQHLSYEKQLEYKQTKVENLLKRVGKIENYEMLPIIGMKEPYYYRNKAQFPVGKNKDGEIITGFYAGRTHAIIDTEHCYIQHPLNEHLVRCVKQWMVQNHIEPYDETTGQGLVRHILTRIGFKTKEVMVCLVINGKKLPKAEKLIEFLKDIPGMTSISININQEKTNVILGRQVVTLWGRDYIEDYIGDVKFRISPLSFYQVNPIQTEVLYNKAIEFAGLTGKERVIDAYSGIGTIGMVASDNAGEVISVELNGDAVRDAVFNAKQNKVKNIRFYKEDAGDFMVKMASHKEQADVVFMDPPRSGSDKKFLDSLLRLRPKKVVYISCNPETLARDLKHLTGNGYRIKEIQPVDMFPSTGHVEAVCLLSRREK